MRGSIQDGHSGTLCKQAYEYDGWTPVHAASQFGHLDVVRYLVSEVGLAGDTPANNDALSIAPFR